VVNPYWGVVVPVGRSNQPGTCFKIKADIGSKAEGAQTKGAGRDPDASSTRFGKGINLSLKSVGDV